jgi:hypothetical protein
MEMLMLLVQFLEELEFRKLLLFKLELILMFVELESHKGKKI